MIGLIGEVEMDKMKELLEKIGASPELAKSICEEMERYSKSLKEQYDKEFQTKLGKAKQVCIEEVAREKVNLARKIGVFLESKARAIEQSMTKQRVAEDTEATALLKKTKCLLEGINVEGGAPSRELAALSKKADRLGKALVTIKEERDRAVSKANRSNSIAVKVLQRNQLLEGKLKVAGISEGSGSGEVCECAKPVAEGANCKTCGKHMKGVKTEGVNKGKAIVEAKPSAKPIERLDAGRTLAEKPKSTRRTLIESEVPVKTRTPDGSPDIGKIAGEMPE